MERIAVFGGSFDPPHDGHVHIAEAAKRELNADKVIWSITPVSPHKTATPPAPYRDRFIASKRITQHLPFIHVSDIERRISARCSFDILKHLTEKKDSYRRYVWIAGSDVIPDFHRWTYYEQCLQMMPFAFFARGCHSFTSEKVRKSVLINAYRRCIHTDRHDRIFRHNAPSVHLIDIPTHPASSSDIRDKKQVNNA